MTMDTWAQSANCVPARKFASGGQPKPVANAVFDVTGTHNNGTVIGRLWDTDNGLNANNGLSSGENLNSLGESCTGFGCWCTPAEFWVLQPAGTYRVEEFLGGSTCPGAGCPVRALTVVIEDYDEAGPPGVGGTAYFVGMNVDDTPVSARRYDYGLCNGSTENTTYPMIEFPKVDIQSSSRGPNGVIINYVNLNVEDNVHGWYSASSEIPPTAETIAQWQLVQFVGDADPGRLREGNWDVVQTTDYNPGDAPASWEVECDDNPDLDSYVAIGIGFNGGAAGVVNSALVGEAIQLECDPNLAQPGEDLELAPRKKPKASAIEYDRRSGGRR
jgi:hypothetical protein